MRFLLDTCVLSEFMKRRPEPRVVGWAQARDQGDLFVSVVTIGELKAGIEQMPEGARRNHFLRWLHDTILRGYANRIVDLDTQTLLRWGEIVGSARKHGRPPAILDSLIAAAALEHGMCVATRNESDFTGWGVTIVNPWA